MTIAVSVLFAALVGGVAFALIDRLTRREADEPAPAEEPQWEPPPPPPPPVHEPPPSPLWSGWSER